jgi:hypothetical protein
MSIIVDHMSIYDDPTPKRHAAVESPIDRNVSGSTQWTV